jgi:glucose-1-phosphate adenylyltransferase
MDLRSATPAFDLYNREWPVYTHHAAPPPAKFVHNEDGRTGSAVNSIVSGGCIISGASVVDSVVGAFARLNSWASVEGSILFDSVTVGRGAKIRRAIIDEGIVIEAKDQIGFDRERDRERGYYVSPEGIVVVGRAPYAAEDPWRSTETG